MNCLKPLLLALTLFAVGPNLEAICESPPEGPQGPFATNYIDSYRNTPQTLTNGVPANVVFPNNSLSPVGITKSGTFDSFIVQHPGVYLISFEVNATITGSAPVLKVLELTLKINNVPVPPIPMASTNALVGGSGQIAPSGQTLLTLSAGDVVTLEALSTLGTTPIAITIDSALFNIIQIAETP